jgi:molybdopterin converting factor small subunit
MPVETRRGTPDILRGRRTPDTLRTTPSFTDVATTVYERPTRVDLVKPADIAPTQEREIDKKERGCVVRALESALGAPAAESEWQDRFNQMSDTGPYKEFREKHKNLTPKQEEFLRGQEIAYADAKVADLIKDYRKHASALGSALRDKEVEEYGRQDHTGIEKLIDAGRVVTIIGRVDGGSRHMVHITKDEQGRMITTSDNGDPVTLDGEYTTIAFADKGQPPVELPVRERKTMRELPHLNETIKYNKVRQSIS